MTSPTSKRGFHIFSYKLSKFKKKIDIVKQQIFDTKFDFFTLSETWLTEDYPSSLLHINRYNLVHLDRKWLEPNTNRPKKGGGVAM